MDRKDIKIKISTLDKQGTENDLSEFSPADRIKMVWQVTLDAWSFNKNNSDAQSRLLRHIVRIHRK